MPRPAAGDYAPFFAGYVGLVPEADAVPALVAQQDLIDWLRTIPEADSNVLHAPYTWTTKQVVGHLADAERVFAYRLLRVGRGDATPLPGFDETHYMATADFHRHSFADLVEEFAAVRAATLTLVRHLPAPAWENCGTVGGNAITARALLYIIVGHDRHHGGILRTRFGQSA